MQSAETITTTAALRVAGLSTLNWRISSEQGHYTAAPPSTANNRRWTADDCVPLVWFAGLHNGGMPRPMAGRCAQLLKEAMAREPDAVTLNVWSWTHDGERGHLAISTNPPPEARGAASVTFIIPLAQWRKNARQALANIARKRGGGHARKR